MKGSDAMRAIPETLDPRVVEQIDTMLFAVSRDDSVRIPWAIESGSRAWGFPSPDSDYDCRFIYLREPERYVSLWPERDVIEMPLDAVFDVNGWDLAKAVKLIVKGNATAIEWLRSPIVYSGTREFRDAMLGFASEVVERAAIGRHYLHVAQQQKAGSPSLKRAFSVLRPAMALRWLRVHPDAVLPPMDLPALTAESEVPREVAKAIAELIALKSVTRELGDGRPPAVLEAFVAAELSAAEGFGSLPSERNAAEVRLAADRFFRRQLDTFG